MNIKRRNIFLKLPIIFIVIITLSLVMVNSLMVQWDRNVEFRGERATLIANSMNRIIDFPELIEMIKDDERSDYYFYILQTMDDLLSYNQVLCISIAIVEQNQTYRSFTREYGDNINLSPIDRIRTTRHISEYHQNIYVAMRTGNNQLSEVYRDPVLGMIITATSVIKNVQHQSLGVIEVSVSLNDVVASIRNQILIGVILIIMAIAMIFVILVNYERLTRKLIIQNDSFDRLFEDKIQEELKRERDRADQMTHQYQSILDAVPFPITVTDVEKRWTFVNKAVERFLGKSRKELYGKECSEWGATICNTDSCGIECVKRGEPRTFFSHNDTEYQVDVTILRDTDSNTTGYVEVVQELPKR